MTPTRNQLARFTVEKKSWLFWVLLLTLAGLLLWLAPEERTLGRGIRSVYVHVALIWVGMVGLGLAGLIGLGVMVVPNRKMARWMQTIGWVGLAFYAAGVGASIVASKSNWGNVFWQEPRMRTALNMLAVILIVEIVNDWLPWIRLRGLLSVGLLLTLLWTTFAAPLVLHPRSPITTSTSAGIQMTFLALFLVFASAAAWLVRRWRQREHGYDN